MIFVTGGTGFLGQHLLRELVSSGRKVRALKRKQSPLLIDKVIAAKVEWAEGDILDLPSLEDGMRGCNFVYHCAAKVSFQSKDRKALTEINVEGTANVVNVALHHKIVKLLHVSSVAGIAAKAGNLPANENDDGGYSLTSNYGLSKFLAEREVWRGIAEGLNTIMINPSVIIGSGNWLQGTPGFFLKVWRGMPFYTSGGCGFVAVQDVVKIMVYLMESRIENERFIISAEDWSYKDFLTLIAKLQGKRSPNIQVPRWLSEFIWRFESVRERFLPYPSVISKETARLSQLRQFFDSSKVKNMTGFRFTPIKSAIEDTCMQFLKDVKSGKIEK